MITTSIFINLNIYLQALDWLHAERIGHGYFIVQDEELYNTIKRNKIHLEVIISIDSTFQNYIMYTDNCNFTQCLSQLCPTSSLLTGAVPSFENHPAKRFVNSCLLCASSNWKLLIYLVKFIITTFISIFIYMY